MPLDLLSDSLKRGDYEKAEEWARYAETFRREMDDMQRLLSGTYELKSESFDFNDLIASLKAALPLNSNLAVSSQLPVKVQGDKSQLVSALLIILGNVFRDTIGTVNMTAWRYDPSFCAIDFEFESHTVYDIDTLLAPFHSRIATSKLVLEAMGGSVRFSSTSNRHRYRVLLPFKVEARNVEECSRGSASPQSGVP